MKIKILNNPRGAHKVGDIVEAIKSPNINCYSAYDCNGAMWHYYEGSFSELTTGQYFENVSNPSYKHSLKEMLGQDVKTSEFK